MISMTRAEELYQKYDKGEMDINTFLKQFGKEEFFYSTPFGEKKDGRNALFVLEAPDNCGFLPVFTTTDRAKEFFEKMERAGYLLMKSTFHDILSTAKKANEKAPVKLGVIVDPGYPQIHIEAKNLDAVIELTK